MDEKILDRLYEAERLMEEIEDVAGIKSELTSFLNQFSKPCPRCGGRKKHRQWCGRFGNKKKRLLAQTIRP